MAMKIDQSDSEGNVSEERTKKDTKAKIRRVFRVENPPLNESLHTLNIPKRVENGVEFPAVSRSRKPDHAQQIVLPDTSDYYEEELATLRRFEKKGKIKEVDPKDEGRYYLTPDQLEYKATLDKLKALQRKLGPKRAASLGNE